MIEDLVKQSEVETTQKTTQKTTEKTESNQETTRKSGLENEIDVENGLKITQKTTEEAETTQKILSLIKQKSDITRQELAEACRISSDGIKWQLKKLQEKGVIRRVGPDKGGHWEIVGSL